MPEDQYFGDFLPDGYLSGYFPQAGQTQTGGLIFGGAAAVEYVPASAPPQVSFGGGGYMNSPARKKAVRRKREAVELVLGLY